MVFVGVEGCLLLMLFFLCLSLASLVPACIRIQYVLGMTFEIAMNHHAILVFYPFA